MSTFPTSPRAAFMSWCETHAGVFAEQAGAIGLSEEQAEAFAAATAELQAAVLEQADALGVYEAATRKVEDRRAGLRVAAGGAVASIRAFAELQERPLSVYMRAQISPPPAPTPAPPPAQPQRLSATIEALTGNITLRWKASNPANTSGTTYLIRRRISYFAPAVGEGAANGGLSARSDGHAAANGGGSAANGSHRAAPRQITGPWEFLGVTGKKRFVDATLTLTPEMFAGPAAPQVQYTVQGQRADRGGPVSDGLLVQLGQSPAAAESRPPRAAGVPSVRPLNALQRVQ